jgi:hypothetical protein
MLSAVLALRRQAQQALEYVFTVGSCRRSTRKNFTPKFKHNHFYPSPCNSQQKEASPPKPGIKLRRLTSGEGKINIPGLAAAVGRLP